MAGSGSRPKALAVDDDPTVVKLLVHLLTNAGFEALGANDAAEAWTALQAGDVSIMITDLQMPGGSGLDLVKRLRVSGNDVPAILLSGTIDDETRAEASRMAKVACMTKPPDFSHLLQEIKRLRGAKGR